MTVGAPAAEADFKEAILAAQKESKHVVDYPVLYVGCLALVYPFPILTDISGFPRFATQKLALGTQLTLCGPITDSLSPRSSAMGSGTGLFLMGELMETVRTVRIPGESLLNP
jgi:hypothetical protein